MNKEINKEIINKVEIYGNHRRFNINTISINEEIPSNINELIDIIYKEYNGFKVKKLYILQQNNTNKVELYQTCQWDSGLYGIIFISRETALYHFHKPLNEITDLEIDKLYNLKIKQINKEYFNNEPEQEAEAEQEQEQEAEAEQEPKTETKQEQEIINDEVVLSCPEQISMLITNNTNLKALFQLEGMMEEGMGWLSNPYQKKPEPIYNDDGATINIKYLEQVFKLLRKAKVKPTKLLIKSNKNKPLYLMFSDNDKNKLLEVYIAPLIEYD